MVNHMGQVFSRGAEHVPNDMALIAGTQRLTYGDVQSLVERAAAALLSLGLQPGQVVVLFGANRWEWVVSYYAVLRAGGVIAPVNTMFTAAELRRIVHTTGAQTVVLCGDVAGKVAASLPGHVTTIATGPFYPPGAIRFDRFLSLSGPLAQPVNQTETTCCSILFTSGTTDRPRGVMHAHRSVIASAMLMAQTQQRNRQDRSLHALPCAHAYAIAVMNATLMTGGTLVLPDRADPAQLSETISKIGVTLLDGTPHTYLSMLPHLARHTYDLSSLRRAYVGGQSIPPAQMHQIETALGVSVSEIWGMTELAGMGATHPVDVSDHMGSAGRALPGCDIRVSPGSSPDAICPPDQIGQLYFRGPTVMLGYFADPDRTKATLTSDGWMRSGDLVRKDEQGNLTFVERATDVIYTNSGTLYPSLIERAIARHPKVAQVAVGRHQTAQSGDQAKAYIVLADTPAADTSEHDTGKAVQKDITTFCATQLPNELRPYAIQCVAALPRTSNGKVMRTRLHHLDDPATAHRPLAHQLSQTAEQS